MVVIPAGKVADVTLGAAEAFVLAVMMTEKLVLL